LDGLGNINAISFFQCWPLVILDGGTIDLTERANARTVLSRDHKDADAQALTAATSGGAHSIFDRTGSYSGPLAASA